MMDAAFIIFFRANRRRTVGQFEDPVAAGKEGEDNLSDSMAQVVFTLKGSRLFPHFLTTVRLSKSRAAMVPSGLEKSTECRTDGGR